MKNKDITAIIFAVAAAAFYAINMPFSKMLLEYVPSALMAGALYLGAGIGVGIMFAFNHGKTNKKEFLDKKDTPYVVGMVLLDILAPIFLMYGLSNTTSSNAALLNNFEIVATTVIALFIFKEAVSKRLWLSIAFVTASGIILTFEDVSGLKFSWGSLLVLVAAVCWGFENNCTRSISGKNTYQIVTVKGICSGIGSVIVGVISGERFPNIKYMLLAMLLGFVAYGLSIFFYIKAQNKLGASKTSAYYAIAPFIGAFLSFVILKEELSLRFAIALVIMMIGSVIATIDTLKSNN